MSNRCWAWCLTVAAVAPAARANDWPQWQGPDRTAVSKETGLLKTWPKGGPPLLWRATNLGAGFSTPSVAAGRIFTMGNRGKNEEADNAWRRSSS